MSTATRSRLVPLPLPRHCNVSYAGETAESWRGVNVSDHLTRYWSYMLRVDLERALHIPVKPPLDPLYHSLPTTSQLTSARRPLRLITLAARITHSDGSGSVVEVARHANSVSVVDALVEELGNKVRVINRRVYDLRGSDLRATGASVSSMPFRLPPVHE